MTSAGDVSYPNPNGNSKVCSPILQVRAIYGCADWSCLNYSIPYFSKSNPTSSTSSDLASECGTSWLNSRRERHLYQRYEIRIRNFALRENILTNRGCRTHHGQHQDRGIPHRKRVPWPQELQSDSLEHCLHRTTLDLYVMAGHRCCNGVG